VAFNGAVLVVLIAWLFLRAHKRTLANGDHWKQ